MNINQSIKTLFQYQIGTKNKIYTQDIEDTIKRPVRPVGIMPLNWKVTKGPLQNQTRGRPRRTAGHGRLLLFRTIQNNSNRPQPAALHGQPPVGFRSCSQHKIIYNMYIIYI